MKYRRRPVVVDAVQWTGDNLAEVSELIGPRANRCSVKGGKSLVVETGHSAAIVIVGEWVICQPGGAFDVCSAASFEVAYERVPSSALPWIHTARGGTDGEGS